MKDLLKQTLNLNIDNLPKVGKTSSEGEYREIIIFLDSVVRLQAGLKPNKSIIKLK